MKSDKGKKYPRIFSIFRKRRPVKCVYAGPEPGARVYAGPEPVKPRPQEEKPIPMCVYAGPEYFEELARKRREEEVNAEEATDEEEAKANDADDDEN